MTLPPKVLAGDGSREEPRPVVPATFREGPDGVPAAADMAMVVKLEKLWLRLGKGAMKWRREQKRKGCCTEARSTGNEERVC